MQICGIVAKEFFLGEGLLSRGECYIGKFMYKKRLRESLENFDYFLSVSNHQTMDFFKQGKLHLF